MRRGWAWLSIASLALAACAAVQNNVSSVSPIPSSSAPEASPSPSPSPTAPLTIASLPVHSGEVGFAYPPVTLTAKGGLKPYTWSTTAVPPGLLLSPGGVLSGNPTVTGTYKLTLTVSDSAGGSAIGRATVVVYPQLAMTELCASKCVVGKGCTRCGTFGIVKNGLAPYTYRVVGGAIPKGMTLKGLALAGGFPVGTASLSVMVTDKLGATVQVDASWSVYSPAALIKGAASDCIDSANPPSCTAKWSYSGGSPSVTPQVVITGYSQYLTYPTPTGPPPNWKVAIASGNITITAGGVACNTAGYYGYVFIQLRDPAACATTSPSNTGSMVVSVENNC